MKRRHIASESADNRPGRLALSDVWLALNENRGGRCVA